MTSGDRTPQYPGFGIQRKIIMLVLLTMMVSQVAVLQSISGGQEAIELHRLVVPFVLLFGFWPEVIWLARMGDMKIRQFRSSNEVTKR